MALEGGTLEVNMPAGWYLPPRPDPDFNFGLGTLLLQADKGVAARVTGEPLTVGGEVRVSGGSSFIEVDLTLESPGTIDVGFLSTLHLLGGTTTLDGGSITGAGTLVQLRDIHVVSSISVDTDTFDWGNSKKRLGIDRRTSIIVDPGVTFTVNAAQTGEADNEHRGRIDLNSGHLVVNTGPFWTLPAAEQDAFGDVLRAGILNLNRTAQDLPTVDGQPLIVTGQINVNAKSAEMHNRFKLGVGSRTEFLAEGELLFSSQLVLEGATIDHNAHHSAITTDIHAASLGWLGSNPLTVQGDSGGSLTFDLGPNTTVGLDISQITTMTIDPGATVRVGGVTDPFTDSVFNRRVAVLNNSTGTFYIDNTQGIEITWLDGIGNTVVGPGAELRAAWAQQNELHISSGASLAMRKSGGSLNTTSGLLNDGALLLPAGDFTVGGPVEHNGDVQVNVGDSVRFTGPVTGPGTFSGPGTVIFDGGYAPGASPGVISFFGNVAFGTNNTLEIELGGPTSGLYDRLDVLGDVVLGGTLEVLPINGFVPMPGQSFTLMNWTGTRSGTFDQVVSLAGDVGLPGLSFGLSASDDPNGSASVPQAVTLEPMAMDGDVDFDGVVGDVDLSRFLTHFGTSEGATWVTGDLTLDGSVGDVDLSRLLSNFGQSIFGSAAVREGVNATGGGGVTIVDSIPEPSTILLAAALVPFFLRRHVKPLFFPTCRPWHAPSVQCLTVLPERHSCTASACWFS